MRIGIFSESFDPVLNGVTVSIATLRGALDQLGHETFVFAPSYPGHRDTDPNVFRFPSVCPPTARDYPLALPFKPGILRIARSLRLDIIHTQTPFSMGWAGLWLGRRLRIPVVSTNHTQYAEYTHYFPWAPEAWRRGFIVRMLRKYYNSCDLVVTPSAAMEEILLSQGVTKPIRVVPTGNELCIATDPETRAAMRMELKIAPEETVLLYVGRLAKEKNLSLLLDSFGRLAKKHPDLRLVLIGGGPYAEELKREVTARGLSDRVIVAGPLPRERVGQVYCAGDIFVFPSTTETQGLVLGEALTAGLPCVAVRAGGSPEMLRDGEDSLLTKDDAGDFTAKIETLLTDRGLRQRFSACALENSRRFRPEEMAKSMLRAYEEALSRR